MKQLCYISYISDGYEIKSTVEEIKMIAEVNNKKHALTGILVYSNEIFIQFLEGEDVNVDVAYTIIKHDKRNFNHQVLFEQSSTERFYPQWFMNFKFADKVDIKSINSILKFSRDSKDKEFITKSEIHSFFDSFISN